MLKLKLASTGGPRRVLGQIGRQSTVEST